jgi:hypothetical protein
MSINLEHTEVAGMLTCQPRSPTLTKLSPGLVIHW